MDKDREWKRVLDNVEAVFEKAIESKQRELDEAKERLEFFRKDRQRILDHLDLRNGPFKIP